jgi:hypothetical protein
MWWNIEDWSLWECGAVSVVWKDCFAIILKVKQLKRTLTLEALWSIKTGGACDSATQRHIPECTNPPQHHCENLISCNCFRFATQSDSGLLLYNGRYNEKHDFIALEIVDGAIHFSFSLGSNVTTTVATLPHRVNSGNWHSVTVQYFNKVKKLHQPFFLHKLQHYLPEFLFNFKYAKCHAQGTREMNTQFSWETWRNKTTRRPWRRWENSIKVDLKEMEWESLDWNDLA